MWKVAIPAAILALAAPATTGAQQIPMVKLRIEGIRSDEDAKAVMDALIHMPNAKVANRLTVRDPVVLVGPLQGAKWDLGQLAQTVAEAKTPSRSKGVPSASLILTCSAKRDEALARNLEATCAKLKGVDAKKCKLDPKRKEVHIKLDDRGGAKWAEIKAAFPGLEPE